MGEAMREVRGRAGLSAGVSSLGRSGDDIEFNDRDWIAYAGAEYRGLTGDLYYKDVASDEANLGARRWFVGIALGYRFEPFRLLGIDVPVVEGLGLKPLVEIEIGRSKINYGKGEIPTGGFDYTIGGGGFLTYSHYWPDRAGVELGVGSVYNYSFEREYSIVSIRGMLTVIF